MQVILQIIFLPAQQVIRNPALALVMALGFAGLLALSILHSGRIKPWTHVGLLLTVISWIAFGMNEYRFQETRNPIRLDLLIFWPPLLLISLATAWFVLRDFIKPRAGSQGIASRNN